MAANLEGVDDGPKVLEVCNSTFTKTLKKVYFIFFKEIKNFNIGIYIDRKNTKGLILDVFSASNAR